MKNLSFIHITKTGGTSIEDWGLKNDYKWGRHDNSMKKYNYHKFNDVSIWHIPAKYFDEEIYKDKVTFTCIRNPYTRIISEYYCYWSGSLKIFERDKDEFNSWIQNLLSQDNVVSALPQYLYQPVDNIIYFENIQDDFRKLLLKYNIYNNPQLPHSNQSKYLGEKFTINDLYPETIKLINEKYKLDFKLFNYDMI